MSGHEAKAGKVRKGSWMNGLFSGVTSDQGSVGGFRRKSCINSVRPTARRRSRVQARAAGNRGRAPEAPEAPECQSQQSLLYRLLCQLYRHRRLEKTTALRLHLVKKLLLLLANRSYQMDAGCSGYTKWRHYGTFTKIALANPGYGTWRHIGRSPLYLAISLLSLAASIFSFW